MGVLGRYPIMIDVLCNPVKNFKAYFPIVQVICGQEP